MFWICISLLLQVAWADVPLTIRVDEGLETVTLICPDGRNEVKPVENGTVTFDQPPESCEVKVTRSIGTVDRAGTWACSTNGCTLEVPPHAPVSDGPGKINLIFLDSGKATTIELACPGGYRNRESIKDFTTVFDEVPKGECTVYAKGGSTAKFHPIGWGTHACTVAGPTLLCQPYKP